MSDPVEPTERPPFAAMSPDAVMETEEVMEPACETANVGTVVGDAEGPEYMVIPPEPYILTPDEATVRPPLMVTPELIVAPLDAVTAPATVSVLWMLTEPAAVRLWIFVLPFPMIRLPLLTLMLPD